MFCMWGSRVALLFFAKPSALCSINSLMKDDPCESSDEKSIIVIGAKRSQRLASFSDPDDVN